METEVCGKLTLRPIIIDLGIGNIASLVNAFRFIGVEAAIGNSAEDIQSASHLVLPGVGAFDPAMHMIDQLNIRNVIRKEVLEREKPIIGICLGMQLLFQSSEEGTCEGLGLAAGRLERLSADGNKPIKVPHAGFSHTQIDKNANFFADLKDTESFYFTHSYAVRSDPATLPAAICDYGFPFVAAFQVKNIFGAQFHPEKSQSAGLRCLINFLKHGTNK